MRRVLIAGVGNIFLGDDGFGVEVARRLGACALPEDVEVADFGIRAIDLHYALEDGYDAVIVVDASPQGGTPGSLYVIEPRASAAPTERVAASPHDLDPTWVLQMLRSAGGSRAVVVGCEPQSFGTEHDGEGRIGLSEPVAAAVARAVQLVESLASSLLQGGGADEHWLRAGPIAGAIHLDGGRR